MVVFQCRECDTAVSRPVAELTDETLLRDGKEAIMISGAGEPDYVPEGFYLDTPGSVPIRGADGWPVLNPEDTVETMLDMDVYTGCCGPSGHRGPNTDCPNGHKIGIEKGECYTDHCIALAPWAVVATKTEETIQSGLEEKSAIVWLETARDGSLSDRRRAIVLLGINELREAVPLLAEIVTDGPEPLHEAAVRALYRMPSPEAVPALETALNAPAPSLRHLAARALGEVDSDEATQALWDRLVLESDPQVCDEIKKSVTDSVTPERAWTCFQTASSDAARDAIVDLFRFVRSEEAADRLFEIATEAEYSPSVRRGAFNSLRTFGPGGASSRVLSATELNQRLLDVAETVDQKDVKYLCVRRLAYQEMTATETQSRRYRLFKTLRDDPETDPDVRSAAREYFDED